MNTRWQYSFWEERAGQKVLRKHKQVSINGNYVLISGNRADKKTEAHKHNQRKRTQHQQFKTGHQAISQCEMINVGAEQDQNDHDQQLKKYASKAFPYDNIAFADG